ncbi:AraC family transcriptional regulator [Paenibacillus shunpengii]|uniref:AraC family transcriptional regulator n=1 Tax=Paenibacillus shunpengii TaxID=2054424 RepID=A0ABW5SQ21_9BACL|nr:AraC family transcriptional regulator [Paenibacillus sp. PDC88]SDX19638.1 AraC-type DNA-binding protein [Paenibacillus sp. PDC88]
MNHATTLAGHDFVVTDIMYVLDRHPDPQWRLRSNFCNPHYVIAYCKSGQAEYHYNNEQVNVGKGDVLLFPKLYQHGAASDPHDPWSFLTVAFELADLQGTAEKAIESLPRCMASSYGYEMHELFGKLYRSWTSKKPGYLLLCRGLLMEMLYLIVRQFSQPLILTPQAHTIEKLMDDLQAHVHKTYSVDELAARVGLSPSYFRTVFKQTAGMTAIEYQNQLKINKAGDLLLGGYCNVSEAAEAVGFKDIYYFSRLFKKITGMPPSTYLKNR